MVSHFPRELPLAFIEIAVSIENSRQVSKQYVIYFLAIVSMYHLNLKGNLCENSFKPNIQSSLHSQDNLFPEKYHKGGDSKFNCESVRDYNLSPLY